MMSNDCKKLQAVYAYVNQLFELRNCLYKDKQK